MTHTFLVTLDVGSDTDFLAIAQELDDTLSIHSPYPLVGQVKPWSPHSQAGSLPVTPMDVSITQQKPKP